MLDAAVSGQFKGLYCQGEDILQSDPDTKHVAAGLAAMECVIVHDLFLNETANYAHVFLPGTTFLEKDGTFTNAERRINRVRPVMPEASGLSEWEVVCRLARAMGYPMHYATAAEIMDEIARLTPTFAGVSHARLDAAGSLQWPVNAQHPDGAPIMHVDGFVIGKGKFVLTEYVPTEERANQVEVFAAFLARAQAVRRLGSAALDLCFVAAGRFDGFWEEGLNPWDMAAGIVLVREPGGFVSDISGGSDVFGTGSIIAANGELHHDIAAALRTSTA